MVYLIQRALHSCLTDQQPLLWLIPSFLPGRHVVYCSVLNYFFISSFLPFSSLHSSFLARERVYLVQCSSFLLYSLVSFFFLSLIFVSLQVCDPLSVPSFFIPSFLPLFIPSIFASWPRNSHEIQCHRSTTKSIELNKANKVCVSGGKCRRSAAKLCKRN